MYTNIHEVYKNLKKILRVQSYKVLCSNLLLILFLQGGKAKGVENLIQVENPNRVQRKTKKLSQLNQSLDTAKPELSRRERYVWNRFEHNHFMIMY